MTLLLQIIRIREACESRQCYTAMLYKAKAWQPLQIRVLVEI